MKRINFKNISFNILALLVSVTLLVSCGKSNGGGTKPASTSHKIIYTATATNGAVINAIVYSNADGQQTTQTGLSVTTYTSPEITIPASLVTIFFVVQAAGTSSSSTVTTTISVDGVVKETITSSGIGISAQLHHNF